MALITQFLLVSFFYNPTIFVGYYLFIMNML